MNEFEIDNKLFGLFKSKKRLQVLNFFMNNNGSFQFNEIAKQLKIIPSTLEYHIKQLADLGLITHINNQYRSNAYTKLIWSAFHNLSKLEPLIPFLKTHDLPLNNAKLLNDFSFLELKVIPDMITLLSLMKNKFTKKFSKIQLAGAFNLDLEEKMMRFSDLEFKIEGIEIITDYENFIKFINYKNFEFFLSFSKLENIKLFLIDECNFYIALSDDIGILFLPKVNNVIDFQQCLVFEGHNNIQWLRKTFLWLKNQSKKITLTEGFIKDKDLFKTYLKELMKTTHSIEHPNQ
ncbi:MAG: ArsR family transcriptional regulator [Promethearchaeota archaeon]